MSNVEGIIWGCFGFDPYEMDRITCRTGRVQTIYQTITVELSTMTFDDLMAFVGAEEAIAA